LRPAAASPALLLAGASPLSACTCCETTRNVEMTTKVLKTRRRLNII
jgi:hypothetical protein